jgi:hypothetical protein
VSTNRLRRCTARAGLAATVGCAAALPVAGPAAAADVFVQLNPNTVQAGYLVGIRAGCAEKKPARVSSPAFGMVTVQPQDGVLTAAAQVPETTGAGTYRVRLACPDGGSATTTVVVLAAGRPSRGPATGFGGTAGPGPGPYLLAGGVATTVAGAVLGVAALRRRGAPGPRPAARAPHGGR